MTHDPRDPPGAARDRTMAVAELAELEAVIETRAPRGAWCTAGRWAPRGPSVEVNGVGCLTMGPMRPCQCWRCCALRIVRYGVTN